MSSASFRMYRFYRFQVLATFTFFAAMAAGLLVADVADAKPPVPFWFLVLWIAAGCWVGYWFLLRICYRIDVANGVLHWATPVRSGWIPVTELRGARPIFRWTYIKGLSWIEGIDRAVGRPLVIYGTFYNRDDAVSLLDDLQKCIPDAPVRMG